MLLYTRLAPPKVPKRRSRAGELTPAVPRPSFCGAVGLCTASPSTPLASIFPQLEKPPLPFLPPTRVRVREIAALTGPCLVSCRLHVLVRDLPCVVQEIPPLTRL